MTNESTVVIEQQTITNNNSSFSWKKVKERTMKILPFIKPNLINSIVSFVVFLVTLLVTKKLGISLLATVLTYLVLSLLIRPLFEEKFGANLKLPTLSNTKAKSSYLETTSKSAILVKQDRYLIGIALMKAEWDMSYIRIVNLWDFCLKEGIQIQDCREGCYLVARKKALLKRGKSLAEEAKKLLKELERTTLLTRKKFDMEFDNFNLQLIKGQEEILTILNLGLAPNKFNIYQEMSEEDVESLQIVVPEIETSIESGD